MAKKKNAQTEIIGLVMIVVLISLVFLFVIRFNALKEEDSQRLDFINKKLASSTLDVLLDTNTECNDAKIKELLKDCYENNPGSIICNYEYSCDFTKKLIEDLLKDVLKKQKKEYYFSARSKSNKFMEIGTPCQKEQIAAIQYIPLGYGNIEVELDICKD